MVEEIAQVIDELVGGTRRIADLAVGFSRLAGLIESERPERFDLQKLIAECLEMASQDETFADMEIAHLGGSDGPLEAEGVRVDLRCSLMTLLSFLARHAKAKSSPSSGKVVVQATLIEGCPSICVQDEGLQLAEKERSRLFDPKLELDAAQSQSIRLDIGLALAFQLVQRSGGALEVGPSPRGGTVFRMRLGSGLASTASMSPKSPTR
jgi:signal transduction histidine kinase